MGGGRNSARFQSVSDFPISRFSAARFFLHRPRSRPVSERDGRGDVERGGWREGEREGVTERERKRKRERKRGREGERERARGPSGWEGGGSLGVSVRGCACVRFCVCVWSCVCVGVCEDLRGVAAGRQVISNPPSLKYHKARIGVRVYIRTAGGLIWYRPPRSPALPHM